MYPVIMVEDIVLNDFTLMNEVFENDYVFLQKIDGF